MEAINDSSKLVAQALELLRPIYTSDPKVGEPLDISIKILEEALEKLVNKM